MRVLKVSLLNYLKSLKYTFTPLGILSLCLIIGFSIAIPGIINSVKNLVSSVAQTFGGYEVDWDAVSGEFTNFLLKQDWSDLSTTVANLMNKDYLIASFTEIIQNLFPTIQIDVATVVALINQAIVEVIAYILLIFAFIVLGFILGFTLTRQQVKNDLVKRKLWKAIVFSIVDIIISLLVLYGIVKVLMSDSPVKALFIILIILAALAFSLFEGWLVHGVKRVKLTKVLNIWNILALILSDIIVVGIAALTIFLVSLANLPAVTVVIALSVITITIAVVFANAEAYVYYLANDVWFKKESKKLEKKLKEQQQ